MISLLRRFARSKWAIALFVLLMLSFVVVGSQMDVFAGLGPKHVISAGDRSVDQAEFRSDFERLRERLQEQAQRPVTIEEMVEQNVLTRYLETQTRRLGFLEWSWKAGVRPGKALIVAEIRKIPAFFNQVTGQFDEKLYQQKLAEQRVTPARLEQEFRDQYAIEHYGAALFAGARAPRIYGALIANRALETRDGRWFEITQDMAGTAPAPTDQQLQAFLTENAAQLRRPEFRQVSLVLFTPGPEAAAAPISEERIQQRFEFRRSTLTQPETRTFTTLSAPSQEVAARIAAAMRAGQTPEQAGRAADISPARYTDQPRAAIGDPAVAAAVFNAQAGQVTDPVRAQVGFVVAKVDTVTPERPATLAEVREAIVAELRAEDARASTFSRVERFERARDQGQSLIDAARSVQARIVQPPPFTEQGLTPDGQRLNAPPLVLTNAFSLSEGGESEVIDAGQGQYFALRVDDVIPAALPALSEVREQLARQWTARENARRLSARAEALANQIRSGQDIAAVAAGAGATLVVRTGVEQNREAQEALGQGVLQGLFGQGRGQIFSQPNTETTYVVGRVDAIRAPTPALAAPLAEQARPRLTQQLVESLADRGFEAGAERVRARYDLALARQALGLSAAPTPAAPAKAP